MIRIGILGDIGSGKSFVAKSFGCPVFNADNEVNKIYSKSLNCYKKLKKKFPKYIKKYPIDKKKLIRAILDNRKNLKKIVNIVHPIVRKEMKNFIKRNKSKQNDLKNIKPQCTVAGVEVSDYAIMKTLKKVKKYVKKSNFFELPYKDNYFDFIIAIIKSK